MKEYGRLKAVWTFLLTVYLAAAASHASKGFVDGVVATVGSDAILHSDVVQEIMPMMQSLNADAGTPEEKAKRAEELFRQGLEQAIEYHILHREAVALGVEVPEDEVERRMTQMRKQYGTTEAFQQALAESGHTMSDFRDRLRRQMMAISVSMSKRRQFEREAVISESDIAQFYQDNLDEFRYPARYRVRRIFIQAPSAPEERDAAREKLEGIRGSLAQGEDFAEMAKTHSDGPEAAEGGMIGWVRPGDLVEALDSAVATLPVGEVSDVLETEYGLHLLKIEEVESGGVLSLEEARSDIEPLLRQQRGEERYRQWMNTLRRRSNVRVLL